jgi:hypothetical protein
LDEQPVKTLPASLNEEELDIFASGARAGGVAASILMLDRLEQPLKA